MRILILIVIILVLSLLQVTFFEYFTFFNIRPDLLLVTLVLVSLRMSFSGWPLVLGLIAGFLKDSSGIGGFGLNSFLFPFWCFLVLNLSRKITLENNFLRGLLVFVVALLHNIITGLSVIYMGGFILPGIFLRIVFFDSLYTAIALPLLARIINPLFKDYYPENKDEPLSDY
jgi:rod shape-determining protein MreD